MFYLSLSVVSASCLEADGGGKQTVSLAGSITVIVLLPHAIGIVTSLLKMKNHRRNRDQAKFSGWYIYLP
jgi:hypothetical protein